MYRNRAAEGLLSYYSFLNQNVVFRVKQLLSIKLHKMYVPKLQVIIRKHLIRSRMRNRTRTWERLFRIRIRNLLIKHLNRNIKHCSPDDVSLLHLVCGNLPPQLFPISCTRKRWNCYRVRRSSRVSTTACCVVRPARSSIPTRRPTIGLTRNHNCPDAEETSDQNRWKT